MSEKPLTYEGVLEMIRETREAIHDISRATKEQGVEFDRRMRETSRKISDLGSRVGEIVENMIGGNIVDKFQTLGYEITQYHRNTKYEYKTLGIRGEIDMLLENGEIAILIEVKTSLETADVRRHIDRLEKYRRCADARGDKRRFIGAVAGAVVKDEAMDFAHENGMYVIVQSGEAVEIVPVPEGFQAKEW